MEPTITTDLVVAYSQCPRKAYLLLFSPDKGEPNEYIQILEQQRCENQERYLDHLQHTHADVQPYSEEPPQGEPGADQCASPGRRVCRRLWCSHQGGGNIDVREIPLRALDLCGYAQCQQRAEVGVVLCRVCVRAPPAQVACS